MAGEAVPVPGPGLVSVIVPNWNRRELLDACIRSLLAQDYPLVEIIVVDNGSSDGSAGMVRESFPSVRLVAFRENTGFSKAVNAGISASGGEFVALINNDAEADEGWLSHLVRAAGAHGEAGFFASKVLFHADRRTIDTFGDGFSVAGFGYKRGWGEDTDSYMEEAHVLGACGAAAMYRRSMLEDVKVGGEYFDTDFFAFAEDLDLSLRARLRGHACVAVPGAVVYHRLRATSGRGSEGSLFLGHRNFMLCIMKSFPASVILRNIFSIASYAALSALADILKNRRLIYVKSHLAALAMWPKVKPKRAAIQAGRRISASEFQALLTKRWLSLWLTLGRMTRSVAGRGL